MSRIEFMNIKIDNLTMDEALDRIDTLIQENRNAYVVTPNVDHLVRLSREGPLNEAYRDADLILTDGMPLVWISKVYGTPIKEKISGSDLFPQLCGLAAKKKYSMFFLGAAEGVADKAAYNLKNRYHNLQIAGTYSPPIGFENDEVELKKIIDIIKKASPHILIVALGCPKQEVFMFKYRNMMEVPISLGLGASLDFESGDVKRAPKWMTDHGFEWIYRTIQDPKRLGKRYLIDDIKIFSLVWKYR